jgi:hypothetical protein
MKNILKYLTIAGVLILFLPFFRMCGCQKPAEKAVAIDSVAQNADTTNISPNNIQVNSDSIFSANVIERQKTDSSITKVLNSIKSTFEFDGTTNGFQLGTSFPLILIDSVKENQKIDRIDETFISMFLFFLIFMNCFIVVYYSFTKKINIIWILASLNILFLIVFYILLKDFILEIKFGSYLFVINSLLIIYFSFKNKKLTTDVAN